MKAILPLLIFIFQLHWVDAQTSIAEKTTSNSGTFKYISLTGLEFGGLEEVKLTNLTWFSDNVTNRHYDEYLRIKKALRLKTTLEIINKLSEEGWELVTGFQQSNHLTVTYYFRKRYSFQD